MMIVDKSALQTKRSNLDDSMVPAINIVFLLLIFFMIAGQIDAVNSQLELPASNSEADQVKSDIAITVTREAEYLINGTPVNSTLEQELAALSVDENTKMTCLIHRELPASALDPVLTAVRATGVSNLLLATELSR